MYCQLGLGIEKFTCSTAINHNAWLNMIGNDY